MTGGRARSARQVVVDVGPDDVGEAAVARQPQPFGRDVSQRPGQLPTMRSTRASGSQWMRSATVSPATSRSARAMSWAVTQTPGS